MDNNNLDMLYKQVILEHTKHPQNKGLQKNTKTYSVVNPTCGDKVGLQVIFDGDIITSIKHEGVGCSISMASCSIMSEVLCGKTKKDALQLINKFTNLLSKGDNTQCAKDDNVECSINEEHQNLIDDLGDAIVFEGIKYYPARYKCATLSWNAVKEIIEKSM